MRLVPPTASSVESLDEVESSPHLLNVNRSHDSGLAASDLVFNDDSSELSEQARRPAATIINWKLFVSTGNGPVVKSIKTTSIARRRSSKTAYKPSRQFLEREKLTNHTTDESDEENNLNNNSSSIRSSTTTIQNLTIGKIKRSKSLSRHSSLGSNEQKTVPMKTTNKESRRLLANDVKRTTSLKQIHHSSDETDHDEQQDLDLISEPLIKPSSFAQPQRTFVHCANSRPFILTEAIQMKPIDNTDKRRPCHRQNALRYKVSDKERQARISTPIITNHPPPSSSRYQSIERRIPDDISWSVKEKARFFEHTLSTGRENYV